MLRLQLGLKEAKRRKYDVPRANMNDLSLPNLPEKLNNITPQHNLEAQTVLIYGFQKNQVSIQYNDSNLVSSGTNLSP